MTFVHSAELVGLTMGDLQQRRSKSAMIVGNTSDA
jgi:hypothetical protein